MPKRFFLYITQIIFFTRYDPVELDPEEMCKMAKEQPQVITANKDLIVKDDTAKVLINSRVLPSTAGKEKYILFLSKNSLRNTFL